MYTASRDRKANNLRLLHSRSCAYMCGKGWSAAYSSPTFYRRHYFSNCGFLAHHAFVHNMRQDVVLNGFCPTCSLTATSVVFYRTSFSSVCVASCLFPGRFTSATSSLTFFLRMRCVCRCLGTSSVALLCFTAWCC